MNALCPLDSRSKLELPLPLWGSTDEKSERPRELAPQRSVTLNQILPETGHTTERSENYVAMPCDHADCTNRFSLPPMRHSESSRERQNCPMNCAAISTTRSPFASRESRRKSNRDRGIGSGSANTYTAWPLENSNPSTSDGGQSAFHLLELLEGDSLEAYDPERAARHSSKLLRQRPLPLACPFYKFNPADALDCRTVTLCNSADIRRHLLKSHVQCTHCPKCKAIFNCSNDPDEKRRQHLLQNNCETKNTKVPGIPAGTWYRIFLADRLSTSKEDIWYGIWDILFPGRHRPASPYNLSFENPLKGGSMPTSRNEDYQANQTPSCAFPVVKMLIQMVDYPLRCLLKDLELNSFGLNILDGSTFLRLLMRMEIELPSLLAQNAFEDERVTPGSISTSTASLTRNLDSQSIQKLKHHSRRQPLTESRSRIVKDLQINSSETDLEGCWMTDSHMVGVASENDQLYIYELCRDIYGHIRSHIDLADWKPLSRALPDLIKAFAIKIGLGSRDQIYRDIMSFIYLHHEEIIIQLGNLVLRETSDPSTKYGKSDTGSMSLFDKMNLWDSLGQREDFAKNQKEPFRGVMGEEDVGTDSATNIRLSQYQRIIHSSAAWNWLIQHLLLEISLRLYDTFPHAIADNIREKILRQLPAGKASKLRVPPMYRVTFVLEWQPCKAQHCYVYGEASAAREQRDSIFDIVAFIWSSKEAQTATVKEYFNQTWPSGGSHLLSVLQKVVDNSDCQRFDASPEANTPVHRLENIGSGAIPDKGGIAASTLPDGTKIAANGFSSSIYVTVDGPAFSIAELGEQLAWLACALRPPRKGALTHSTASIAKTDYRPLDILACFESSTQRTDNYRETSGERSYMNGKFEFNSFPNIQFASQGSVLGPWLSDSHRSPDLLHRVQPATLQQASLMSHYTTLGFLIDVLLESPLEAQSPCEHHYVRLYEKDVAPMVVQGFPTLRRPHRCSGLEISFSILLQHFEPHQMQSPVDPLRLYSSRISLELVGRMDDVFYWHEMMAPEDSFRRTFTSFKHHSRFLSRKDINEFELRTGRHIICDCESGTFNESKSTKDVSAATQSLTSGLLDPDLLSMSSRSESIELLGNAGPGFRIFEQVFWHLIRLSRSECQDGDTSSCTSTQGPKVSQSNTGQLLYMPSSSVSNWTRKRLHPGDDYDGESGDEHNRPPFKRARAKQPKCERSQRLLACPFWKLDPVKYRECFLKKIDSIGHLKQHLSRKHTPDFYCQLCYMKFIDNEILDRHVQARRCARAPSAELEGITASQKKELSRRFGGSVEENWFNMWEILFPERQRPSSIYIDPSLSEECCRIREIIQREGVPILINVLQINGYIIRPETSPQEIRETIQAAIEAMLERALFSESPLSTTASSSTPLNPDTSIQSQHETVTASLVDSGVGLSPHTSRQSRVGNSIPPSLALRNETIYQPFMSNDWRHVGTESSSSQLTTTVDFRAFNTFPITPQASASADQYFSAMLTSLGEDGMMPPQINAYEAMRSSHNVAHDQQRDGVNSNGFNTADEHVLVESSSSNVHESVEMPDDLDLDAGYEQDISNHLDILLQNVACPDTQSRVTPFDDSQGDLNTREGENGE